MRFIVVRRTKPHQYIKPLIIVLSLLTGMILVAILLVLIGAHPVTTLVTIAYSFITPQVVKDMLLLTMLGCALLISFKGAVWNVGAEGQLYVAIIPIVWITLYAVPWSASSPPHQQVLVILASITVAALFGAAWGAIAGALRAYVGIDEVPVTLIMNYVAYYLVNLLILGPFRGRYVYGYIRTDDLPDAYKLSINIVMQRTGNAFLDGFLEFIRAIVYYAYWVLAAILVALLTWVVFNYTSIGLRIKILGSNPEFLKAVGVDARKTILTALALSGSLVGIASAIYYLGDLTRLTYPIQSQTASYGYLAILVAWLSMLELPLIPLSAYVVSSLRNAGRNMQIFGLGGLESTLILLGSILLTYSTLRFLTEYEVRVVK
ncbi:MAG: ABC transporter permease [Desulfurococcaceae archaeon]|nr:hypothetical protein [Sulfolobales archaeon]MDW8170217.1 ABC transporter permease [Desulfurococcaceae archaeon]